MFLVRFLNKVIGSNENEIIDSFIDKKRKSFFQMDSLGVTDLGEFLELAFLTKIPFNSEKELNTLRLIFE